MPAEKKIGLMTDVGTMDNNIIDKTHPAWKLARVLDFIRTRMARDKEYLARQVDLDTVLMLLVAMAIRIPDDTGGLRTHKGNPTHADESFLSQNLNIHPKRFNRLIGMLQSGNEKSPGLDLVRQFNADRKMWSLVMTEDGERLREILLSALEEVTNREPWSRDDELVPKDHPLERLKRR